MSKLQTLIAQINSNTVDTVKIDYFVESAPVVSLFNALHNNTSVKVLDLSSSHNILKNDNIINALVDMLKANKHIKSLNLSNCNIVGNEINSLSGALLKHPTLTTLNLAYNQIATEVTGIIDIIKNGKITSFDLSRNHLTKVVADALIDALKSNINIIEFDIHGSYGHVHNYYKTYGHVEHLKEIKAILRWHNEAPQAVDHFNSVLSPTGKYPQIADILLNFFGVGLSSGEQDSAVPAQLAASVISSSPSEPFYPPTIGVVPSPDSEA